MTKKIIKIISSVIVFCIMIFFGCKFLCFFNINEIQTIEPYSNVKPVDGTEKCCFIENEWYVINKTRGIIQVFDNDGSFIKGFQLPTNGGDVWAGTNEDLYVYCVRTDLLYSINSSGYTQEKIEYANSDEFYKSFDSKKFVNLSTKRIIDNETQEIQLKAPFDFSLKICLLISAICLMFFFLITGLWKKLNV